MGHPKFNGQRHYTEKDIKILEEHVRSCSISNVSKLEIMEQAVAPCPEVNLKAKGTEFKSLLDFGSMVSLMNESFFRSQLASSITPMAGDKVNAHQLFNLKGVEDGQVPLSKYFEMDVDIRGFKIPQVGFLVKKDNAPLLDSKGKSSRLPAKQAATSYAWAWKNLSDNTAMHHLSCLNAQRTSTHYSFPRFVCTFTPNVKRNKMFLRKKNYMSV